MSAGFLKILNMSITASWLILAVILARFLLKKAPKWTACLLWTMVAIRLICPISFESVFSLIPSGETIPADIAMVRSPAISSGITIVNEAVNPLLSASFTPDPTSSANPLQIVIPVAALVWVAGIAALLIYALVSYLKLKKTVSASLPLEGRIMVCDEVKAPFILGVFRPVIYVPSSMRGETLDHVIRHETAHLQRRDHWWKPLGFLLLTVYWFNPLCWIAYILLCRDIEMACDERVIRDMDKDGMAAYSQALLDCSFPRRRIAACPLSFGEVSVKERVKGVLNYKKPAFWIIAAAVVVCAALAICLMTDPFSDNSLSDKLAVSMDMAVAGANRSPYSDGHFIATDYDVLRVTRTKDETTVYAWVFYEEYSYDGREISVETGSHIPTVITFDTSDDESDSSTYEVIEYWTPRDGGYYTEDIRAKFPITLWARALDPSGAARQKENCFRAAREYYGADGVSGVVETTAGQYWLTIGEEGVKTIWVTTPYASGGCQNADGSLYRKGERVWLELLDGYRNLRGVSIAALDEHGTICWSASIPDQKENEGFTRLTSDDWTVTNLSDICDLSRDGTVECILSAVCQEGVAGSVRLRTNSERIRVKNNADIDIVCLLYDVEYDEPIQTTRIRAGQTGTFTNLTASHIYQIGIEPVGEEIHLSISD